VYPRFQQTRVAARLLILCLLLLLSACQTPPQTQQLFTNPPAIAKQHQIAQVPFYPQQDFFCGPTTLAEVANFYGLNTTPDIIAPNTFTPGLQGTLQIEMAAATRQLGLVAYEQRGTLSQLLSLIAEDIPIIVLQNNSISWLPQWHYAVVIGYDLVTQEVILHTGVTAEHRLNIATFERTWQRGNYWMLAMLPSSQASKHLEPFLYTKACQDLLNTQQITAGIAALTTATQHWPDYWLPYFLLANHYLTTEPLLAAHWFAQGWHVAQHEIAYLNNYAVLLSQLACHQSASALLQRALQLAPDNSTLLSSQQRITTAQATAVPTATSCVLSLPFAPE